MIQLRNVLAGLAVVLLLFSAVPTVQAQTGGPYDLSWNSITGGGGRSTGGSYILRGSIGQPTAGVLTGGTYTLTGGFWAVPPPKPGDATGDGKVNIFDLQKMALTWNKQLGDVGYDASCDWNEDNKINIFDLQIMAQFWNT